MSFFFQHNTLWGGILGTSQYKSLPPADPGQVGHERGFDAFSLLVSQVISKANECYSPLCPRSGGAGFVLTGALVLLPSVPLSSRTHITHVA